MACDRLVRMGVSRNKANFEYTTCELVQLEAIGLVVELQLFS